MQPLPCSSCHAIDNPGRPAQRLGFTLGSPVQGAEILLAMQRSDPLNLIQFTLAEGWCVMRGGLAFAGGRLTKPFRP